MNAFCTDKQRVQIPSLPSVEKTDVKMSLKAMVACGPFTFEADLDYKPFNAIIEAARTERPDLLLLVGINYTCSVSLVYNHCV